MSSIAQETEWYLSRDGQQFGPMSQSELRELHRLGHIAGSDFLWSAEVGCWIEASEFFGSRQAPPPPPPRKPPPASEQAQQQQRSHDVENVSRQPQQAVTQTIVEGGSFKFSTLVFIVLGLLVPLWPISLPLFWFLAYRSYNKPSMKTVRVMTENRAG